jgi:hypothetical protein
MSTRVRFDNWRLRSAGARSLNGAADFLGCGRRRAGEVGGAPAAHDPRNWTVVTVRVESACLTVPVPGSLLAGAPPLRPRNGAARMDVGADLVQPVDQEKYELVEESSLAQMRDRIWASSIGLCSQPVPHRRNTQRHRSSAKNDRDQGSRSFLAPMTTPKRARVFLGGRVGPFQTGARGRGRRPPRCACQPGLGGRLRRAPYPA